MEAHFSPEVLAGIKRAALEGDTKKNRLRVQVGDEFYPVLKVWDGGFTVSAETAPHLRGLVDLYNGARLLQQCLIVHSEKDGDLIHYEFKRRTQARDTAPKDFAERDDTPSALIEDKR